MTFHYVWVCILHRVYTDTHAFIYVCIHTLHTHTTFCSSVHLLMDRHLKYFRLLGITNNIAMNTGVQISVRTPAFHSFGFIPRGKIAGSHSNSVFNFVRNRHTVSHSGCTILRSYQECTRVPISRHPLQHWLFCFACLFVLIVAVLIGYDVVVTVVWVCISLMTEDVEHRFSRLSVVCLSSLEKFLFKSFAYFWIWLLGFWVLFFF